MATVDTEVLEQIDPQKFEELANSIEQFSTNAHTANLGLERMAKHIGGLGLPDSFTQKMSSTFKSSARDADYFAKELMKIKKHLNMEEGGEIKGFAKLAKGFDIDSVKRQISAAMSGIKKESLETLEAISKEAGATGSTLAALGTLGLAELNKRATEAAGGVTKYNELQAVLMKMQKQALQTGIAMGESFTDAGKSVGDFNTSLTRTIQTTNSTREEIMGVRKSLGEAFAAREVTDSIDSLNLGMQGVKSAINLTNVALTVSKATGMDSSKVAQMMTDVHLKLGGSLEDTALAFGHIRDAAKDSGLTFGAVGDSIVNSAKALKFYGSTVESITPMFKTFNASLKGIGKEGLTPELLDTFVSGLQQMSMGTRALLSLSAPGMRQGGMLGGALQMEQAMETGEGMGDIAQSIVETMKKFTGGQGILTREEAIESPAQSRNFVVQRQILGQLTGIKDAGKQNQMMQILQDIDKHGVSASDDAQDRLGELMAAGEATADETTTDLEKAVLKVDQAVNTQGGRIILELKGIARSLGAMDITQSIDEMINSMTSSTGRVDFKGIERILSSKEGELTSQLKNLNLTKEQRTQVQQQRTQVRKQIGEIKATSATSGIKKEYERMLSEAVKGFSKEAKEEFAKTGKIGIDTHKEIWEKASKVGSDRMKEIDKDLKNTNLPAEKRVALKSERAAIKEQMDEMQKAFKVNKGKGFVTRNEEKLTIAEKKEARVEREKMAGMATKPEPAKPEAKKAPTTPNTADGMQQEISKANKNIKDAVEIRTPGGTPLAPPAETTTAPKAEDKGLALPETKEAGPAQAPRGAHTQPPMADDVKRLAQKDQDRVMGIEIPATAKAGVDPESLKPVTKDMAAGTTATEASAAPQKTEHVLIIKLAVDSAGNIVTEQKAKELAEGISVRVLNGNVSENSLP